jgi:hypothetical protein
LERKEICEQNKTNRPLEKHLLKDKKIKTFDEINYELASFCPLTRLDQPQRSKNRRKKLLVAKFCKLPGPNELN